MRKMIFVFAVFTFGLAACGGNDLDVDIEKTHEAIAERALHHEDKSEMYDAEDIKIIKICEAVRSGEEDFGFDGEYLVSWETIDGELKDTYRMEDYEANLSTNNLQVVSDDRCTEID